MVVESKFDLGQLAYVICRSKEDPGIPEINEGVVNAIVVLRDRKGDRNIRIAVKSLIGPAFYTRSEKGVFNTKQEAQQAIVNRNLGL